uniref:Uncharacterized protein n=1 Tax=Candidatus Kentrum sp. UNK TaxID=2126344 RepID=A0A451ALC0_9GAMM|nr:MAG: hypothetical protein BECKUNK1418G_GA0071005_11102 [Candidatus Kentron sp. UNK]VFK72275.1 MAG: hypothetical protein BECKUNK1418H_GA0071006_11052 [Candidatus Kentron sp. UNK]
MVDGASLIHPTAPNRGCCFIVTRQSRNRKGLCGLQLRVGNALYGGRSLQATENFLRVLSKIFQITDYTAFFTKISKSTPVVISKRPSMEEVQTVNGNSYHAPSEK